MTKRHRPACLPSQRVRREMRTALIVDYQRLKTYKAVARLHKLSPRTVRYWVTHFENRGHVETPPRKSRNPKLTIRYRKACVATCKLIEKDTDEGCPTFTEIHRQVSQSHSVSLRTMRRALFLEGHGRLRKAKNLGLTRRHIQLRLEYVNNMLMWSDADYLNIVFTDEKLFNCAVSSTNDFYVGRIKAPRLRQSDRRRKPFGGKGIMVWMGYSYNYGLFYHVYNGAGGASIDAAAILGAYEESGFVNFFRTHRRAILQMDNAPTHSTVKKKYERRRLDFPPLSPDLNRSKPCGRIWIGTLRTF